MRFLFIVLVLFLPCSTHAFVLPPDEAGGDFVRFFKTGLQPHDKSYFYYGGFGEGNDCEKQADAEAVGRLTNKITDGKKIVNTPSFPPEKFAHFRQQSGFFGRPPRYWGIYRSKTVFIQKQRDKIVSVKILAKKIKENPEEPDEYITDVAVYYTNGKKTFRIGKTPVVAPIFMENAKFVLKKEGFLNASKVCKIDKKKSTCVVLMKPIAEERISIPMFSLAMSSLFQKDEVFNGCLIFFGIVFGLFVMFVRSLYRKE